MAKESTPAPAASAPQTAPAVDTATLANIVNATNAGGFVYISEAVAAPLVAAGYIETNGEMRDEGGNIAARSTDAGNGLIASQSGSTAAPAAAQPVAATTSAPAAKSKFEIDDGVPMPTIKRGGVGGTVYPFDDLNVGQSFHVAATADRANPAKSLASTVSSATARYAVEAFNDDGSPKFETVEVKDEAGNVTGNEQRRVMNPTRVFSVRTVGKDDPKGAGARVWRTA